MLTNILQSLVMCYMIIVAVAILAFFDQSASALVLTSSVVASLAQPSNDTLPWTAARPVIIEGDVGAKNHNDTLPWKHKQHHHHSHQSNHNGHMVNETVTPEKANDTLPWTSGNPIRPSLDTLNSSFAQLGALYGSWGRFCDDTECSVNCGIWVDLTNSGCLQESGRKSVITKSDPAAGGRINAGLVYSPANSCNCQQACDQFNNTGCHLLNTTFADSTLSFRFQHDGYPRTACLTDDQQPGDNC
ncbi:unnamed protein product [Discula destructiva]